MKEIEIKSGAETLIMIGPPGSGKDTQAEFLVNALGYQEISSGQLIRQRATHDEELKKVLDSGGLVEDGLIDDEIISVFALLPEEQPVILNGYPRTKEQAERLAKILAENNRRVDQVIYIKTKDSNLIERIGKRRVCVSCGHFTDDSGAKCPECGGGLAIRDDDTPDSVKRRLELFHKETEPVINYYKELGVLAEVDGNPSVEIVRENIRKAL